MRGCAAPQVVGLGLVLLTLTLSERVRGTSGGRSTQVLHVRSKELEFSAILFKHM